LSETTTSLLNISKLVKKSKSPLMERKTTSSTERVTGFMKRSSALPKLSSGHPEGKRLLFTTLMKAR